MSESITRADNEASAREGWGVFELDDGTTAIQKLDDPYIEEVGYDRPRFESDEEAIVFVRYWAERGSALHCKAMQMAFLPFRTTARNDAIVEALIFREFPA